MVAGQGRDDLWPHRASAFEGQEVRPAHRDRTQHRRQDQGRDVQASACRRHRVRLAGTPNRPSRGWRTRREKNQGQQGHYGASSAKVARASTTSSSSTPSPKWPSKASPRCSPVSRECRRPRPALALSLGDQLPGVARRSEAGALQQQLAVAGDQLEMEAAVVFAVLLEHRLRRLAARGLPVATPGASRRSRSPTAWRSSRRNGVATARAPWPRRPQDGLDLAGPGHQRFVFLAHRRNFAVDAARTVPAWPRPSRCRRRRPARIVAVSLVVANAW